MNADLLRYHAELLVGAEDWAIEQVTREREELEAQNRNFQQWKESMLRLESEWDEQAVGRALGMTLGQPIRRNILPKIEEPKQHVRELEEKLKEECG
jgi:uncharacterized protein YhaN